jgi:hypothetical protein
MSVSLKPNKLYSVLGVGCALLVPALAVGLEIPNAFTAGTAIRAADMNENFEAIGEELAALRSEVETLQAKVKLGERSRLIELDVDTSAAVFQAKSDGLITTLAGGSGLNSVASTIRIGTAMGTDNWSVTCEGEGCSALSKSEPGGTLTVQVAAGEYFVVSQEGAAGAAFARVAWQPLFGDDPANGGPTLIRSGALP